MSLYASVGSYDNLDEPTPFFNNRAAGYGFVITFLVGLITFHNFDCSCAIAKDLLNGLQPGNIIFVRLASIICPIFCDTMPRMGRLFYNIHICSSLLYSSNKIFGLVRCC